MEGLRFLYINAGREIVLDKNKYKLFLYLLDRKLWGVLARTNEGSFPLQIYTVGKFRLLN